MIQHKDEEKRTKKRTYYEHKYREEHTEERRYHDKQYRYKFNDMLHTCDNERYSIKILCQPCGKYISFRYIPKRQTHKHVKTKHTQMIDIILLMGEPIRFLQTTVIYKSLMIIKTLKRNVEAG